MMKILSNRVFAAMFSAQVVALLGTGLLTVALGLLAYDLAGDQAGAVLGMAYAIKMVAYVGLTPVVSALADRLPRKVTLVTADLIRAGVALFLPFVDAVWQIYLLIFILQSASAMFTPAFQATIPDILKDEKDYTQALSLSRLAYDLENLVSPVLAAALLTVITYNWLFMGTVFGFFASTVLILITAVPALSPRKINRPFRERLTRGSRIYLATPRLRGLLALTMCAASLGAFILVNTVVIVRSLYGFNEAYLAYALAAYGGGSMLAALTIPRLLTWQSDRRVMMTAASLLSLLMLVLAIYTSFVGLPGWPIFLTTWALGGMFYSAILTPSGRLLRISSHSEDRPSLFAAQFSLSHVCWLVTYLVAGLGGSALGLPTTLFLLGGLASASLVFARVVWPRDDPSRISHSHPDLPSDHPHLQDPTLGAPQSGHQHRHAFVIDDEHHHWPTHG